MLQRWTDHNGDEHTVKEDYERNKTLIDLHAQPVELKVEFVQTIADASKPKSVPCVGINFLNGVVNGTYKIYLKNTNEMASILNKAYPHE